LSDEPGHEDCPVDESGWFNTGDVAAIPQRVFCKSLIELKTSSSLAASGLVQLR